MISILCSQIYALNFYNYPNPFREKTTFKIELNDTDIKLLKIEIYDENGYKVWSFQKNNNFTSPLAIEWEGKDEKGKQLKAGVYIAKLRIEYKGKTEERVIKVALIKGY